MLINGLRPLARRFGGGDYYEPLPDKPVTTFAGVFELDNPLGTFYPDLAQSGAVTLSEGSSSIVGGFGRVKITADGNAINVPGAWVNSGTESISISIGAVNIISVTKVTATEINYSVKVVGAAAPSGGFVTATDLGITTAKTAAQNATAITAAIASLAAGDTIVFPPGRYSINAFTISKGINFIGLGAEFVFGTQTSGTVHITVTARGVKFTGFTITGQLITTPALTQNGVLFDGADDFIVSDCYFRNINGYGLGANNIPVNHRMGNVLNSLFYNNTIGTFHDTLGQYMTVTGCTFNLNDTGVKILAANVLYQGCVITDSVTTGVIVDYSGANSAHGIFSGCMINHNPINIKVGNATNAISEGQFFRGCNIYAGDIQVQKTANVFFTDCTFGDLYFRTSQSSGLVTNCFISGTVVVDQNYFGTGNSAFIFMNNMTSVAGVMQLATINTRQPANVGGQAGKASLWFDNDNSDVLSVIVNGALEPNPKNIYFSVGGKRYKCLATPEYVDDAAADAADPTGTATRGTTYYNTTTHKMKIKEDATWKTVTTS